MKIVKTLRCEKGSPYQDLYGVWRSREVFMSIAFGYRLTAYDSSAGASMFIVNGVYTAPLITFMNSIIFIGNGDYYLDIGIQNEKQRDPFFQVFSGGDCCQ